MTRKAVQHAVGPGHSAMYALNTDSSVTYWNIEAGPVGALQVSGKQVEVQLHWQACLADQRLQVW